MGNAIAKRFEDVPKECTATAGHLGQYQIRPGVAKDTKEPVSIWSYEKAAASAGKTILSSESYNLTKKMTFYNNFSLRLHKKRRDCSESSGQSSVRTITSNNEKGFSSY